MSELHRLAIVEATLNDTLEIIEFLHQMDLLTDDIMVAGTQYWLARDADQQIVATGGLEYGRKGVLLRSVAITPDARNYGLGHQMFNHTLAVAIAKGYRTMYLFSVRAGVYWRKLGFEQVPMDEMAEVMGDVPQVKRFQKIGKLAHEVAWRKTLG